jgi:8-oxo-dGTP pyrophosphatase MutT (NUDIX family)
MPSTEAMPKDTKNLTLYVAGKVSGNSSFGTERWRDELCRRLSAATGMNVTHLDPARTRDGRSLPETDPKAIFGRDCFLISKADLVLVCLSDDISVGGSQEMLIAKYYGKPLVGLAARGSKFIKDSFTLNGTTHRNWVHPFVSVPCDVVLHDFNELVSYLKLRWGSESIFKSLSVIDDAVGYYRTSYPYLDSHLMQSSSNTRSYIAQKVVVTDKDRGMLVIKYADRKNVSKKVRGKFALPGGKMLATGVDPDQALTQRVKEETGVEVSPSDATLGTFTWSYNRNGGNNRIIALVRKATYRTGSIQNPIRRSEWDLDRAYWLPFSKLSLKTFVLDEQGIIEPLTRR